MSGLLAVVAVLFLLAGGLLLGSIRSDIQIQIIVTCWSAGFVLMGLTAVVRRLSRIERMLVAQQGAPLQRVEPKV